MLRHISCYKATVTHQSFWHIIYYDIWFIMSRYQEWASVSMYPQMSYYTISVIIPYQSYDTKNEPWFGCFVGRDCAGYQSSRAWTAFCHGVLSAVAVRCCKPTTQTHATLSWSMLATDALVSHALASDTLASSIEHCEPTTADGL